MYINQCDYVLNPHPTLYVVGWCLCQLMCVSPVPGIYAVRAQIHQLNKFMTKWIEEWSFPKSHAPSSIAESRASPWDVPFWNSEGNNWITEGGLRQCQGGWALSPQCLLPHPAFSDRNGNSLGRKAAVLWIADFPKRLISMVTEDHKALQAYTSLRLFLL